MEGWWQAAVVGGEQCWGPPPLVFFRRTIATQFLPHIHVPIFKGHFARVTEGPEFKKFHDNENYNVRLSLNNV